MLPVLTNTTRETPALRCAAVLGFALVAAASDISCTTTRPSGRVMGTAVPAPGILAVDVAIQDGAFYALDGITRSRASDAPCGSGLPPERARFGQTIVPGGPIHIGERWMLIRFEFAGSAAAPLGPDTTFDLRLRWEDRREDNPCLRIAVDEGMRSR
jgi:hypothetical protein